MKPFITEKADVQGPANIGDWLMHGDVVIEKVAELPETFNTLKQSTDDALAYGELTGHVHQLFGGQFDLRLDPETPTRRLLRVVEPVLLRHQEHKEITIFKGDYVVRIQREYDPFAKKIREVAD